MVNVSETEENVAMRCPWCMVRFFARLFNVDVIVKMVKNLNFNGSLHHFECEGYIKSQ